MDTLGRNVYRMNKESDTADYIAKRQGANDLSSRRLADTCALGLASLPGVEGAPHSPARKETGPAGPRGANLGGRRFHVLGHVPTINRGPDGFQE